MSQLLKNKSILITGGTGSLGTALVRRISTGEWGEPQALTVFSRGELKQAVMAENHWSCEYLRFIIGDVQDYSSVLDALRGVDIVIHAAAMKRIETCGKFPEEAMATNFGGACNIIDAIKAGDKGVECVVGISSDKGADPLNFYGLTKAAMELRFRVANDEYPSTRFVCVRYGNVMGSRGSVIPIWQEQIKNKKPITITDPDMTRFLISLDRAVDTIMAVIATGNGGDVYIPHSLPAATVGALAEALSDGRDCTINIIGKRPGEKMHETLITKTEIGHVVRRDGYYVVARERQNTAVIEKEYVSCDYLVTMDELHRVLEESGVMK